MKKELRNIKLFIHVTFIILMLSCGSICAEANTIYTSMNVGEIKYLETHQSFSSIKDYTWTSSSSAIEIIQKTPEYCVVKAVAPVTDAKIQLVLHYYNGYSGYARTYTNYLYAFYVTAYPVSPTSVSIDDEVSINRFCGKQLTPTVYPEYATTGYTWTSSNKNVARVDSNGFVTAINPGTAVITVRTTSNSRTALCKVTVPPGQEFSHTLSAPLIGSNVVAVKITSNNNSYVVSPTVIAALYDSDGNLVKILKKKASEADSQGNIYFDTDTSGISYGRAFAWTDLNEFIPLSAPAGETH